MVFLEPHLNCDGGFSSEVMITLEGKYSYAPLSFKHINSCDTIYVIGIANALDLMARFLPRLQSTKCRPQLLHFPPYTKDQIVSLLQARLGSNSLVSPKVKLSVASYPGAR